MTIKNWLCRILKCKTGIGNPSVQEAEAFVNPQSVYNNHEQMFIEKVIQLLKEHPESFSAKWFVGNLENSVRSLDKEILIYIDGSILQPIKPVMTKIQMKEIEKLIAPIIKRDSDIIIEKLLLKHG